MFFFFELHISEFQDVKTSRCVFKNEAIEEFLRNFVVFSLEVKHLFQWKIRFSNKAVFKETGYKLLKFYA